MFDVSGEQMIWLTRGDSCEFSVSVDCGTKMNPVLYELQENDKVFFALTMPNQSFEHAILKKVFDKNDLDENGNIVISLKSTDTEFLREGQYWYEIKLLYADGAVNTIVQKRKFFIV